MKEAPKCPSCGEPLKRLFYTDYGCKQWDEEEETWEAGDGDCEWRCPECNYRFQYEELEEMGVFS